MKVLGVRCSNTDCTFCLLSGSKDSPAVDMSQNIKLPKDFNKAEALNWFSQELETIFKKNKIYAVALKGPEPMVRRSNNLVSRVQNEAIVYLVAARFGIIDVETKVKASIAKQLGLKGKGKYLDTKLDTSVIEGFDNFSVKEREAILVGWSALK